MAKRESGRWGRAVVWLLLAIVAAVVIGVGTGVLPWLGDSSAQNSLAPAVALTHVGAWGRLAPRGDVRSLAAPSSTDGGSRS